MSKRTIPAPPRMEALEDRMLLTATVAYTPASITITGTSAADIVGVAGLVGGQYTVTGATVKSGVRPTVSNNVSITIILGDGSNQANINVAAARNVTITGGKDSDVVLIDDPSTISGFVTINAGDGANSVTVASATIAGPLSITTGKDADVVQIGSSGVVSLPGNVTISTGAGGDNVSINQAVYGTKASVGKVASTFTITTGAGNDTIRIGGATVSGNVEFKGKFSLDAGADNDVVHVASSSNATSVTFDDAATIKTGTGDDALQLASLHLGNSVTVLGKLIIDLGASATTASISDRLGVGVSNATGTVTLNGVGNTITLGTGTKGTTGIRAGSIALKGGSSTTISATKPATLTDALRIGLLAGISLDSGLAVGLTLTLV